MSKYGKQTFYITIIAIIFILFGILSIYFWDNSKLTNLIGIIGSVASFIGVIFARFQILQNEKQIALVGDTAIATKKAVLENRQEITRFLSFSEVAHLIEMIKTTQNHIITENYNAAMIMLQQIKDDLVRIINLHNVLSEERQRCFRKCVNDVSTDIDSLASHNLFASKVENYKSTLHPDSIHKNLESTREILVEIETHFRKEKL